MCPLESFCNGGAMLAGCSPGQCRLHSHRFANVKIKLILAGRSKAILQRVHFSRKQRLQHRSIQQLCAQPVSRSFRAVHHIKAAAYLASDLGWLHKLVELRVEMHSGCIEAHSSRQCHVVVEAHVLCVAGTQRTARWLLGPFLKLMPRTHSSTPANVCKSDYCASFVQNISALCASRWWCVPALKGPLHPHPQSPVLPLPPPPRPYTGIYLASLLPCMACAVKSAPPDAASEGRGTDAATPPAMRSTRSCNAPLRRWACQSRILFKVLSSWYRHMSLSAHEVWEEVRTHVARQHLPPTAGYSNERHHCPITSFPNIHCKYWRRSPDCPRFHAAVTYLFL